MQMVDKVTEISYEDYKKFCSYLPCKDIFYYLKTLFVSFNDGKTIFAVKIPSSANPHDVFNKLKSKNQITEYSLAQFKLGMNSVEQSVVVDKNLYRDKNILVLC